MINESVINDLLEKRAREREVKEKLIENEQEYKDCLNRIFSSYDGEVLYKYLVKFCKVYDYERLGNTVKMIEDNGRRAVFLDAIRPYLNKENKSKLEDVI